MADLAEMAKVSPEVAELRETESEWWLGLFGLDKASSYQVFASRTWPRWRDHTSNPVTERMRLRMLPFERSDGVSAVGVIVSVPEEDFEQYVGWVPLGRGGQLSAWVEFLNREIASLWELWDAAGRPTKPGPTAAQPGPVTPAARPADNRPGRQVADQRFEITEWLGTDWMMGAAIAREGESPDSVRLTFAVDVAGSADEVRGLLGNDVPGLAPVIYIGPTASDDGWASASMMMAERLTSGAKELELPTGTASERELAAAGARLAVLLLAVHRGGVVLGTLRPESTFVTGNGEILLACRGERLWLMPRPHMTKPGMLPPWRPGYQAPELFALQPLLRDPAPPADVFSLGVMLASAFIGEFVYSAQSTTELFVQQRAGTHLTLPSTPLGQVLTRCLQADPIARPTLEEFAKVLQDQPS